MDPTGEFRRHSAAAAQLLALCLWSAACASDAPGGSMPEPEPRGSPGLGDSLYPGFGNGGYDALHYDIHMDIADVEMSDLHAEVHLDAKATQELAEFNLDFIGFTITSAAVNGVPAEFERIGQELTIKPESPSSQTRCSRSTSRMRASQHRQLRWRCRLERAGPVRAGRTPPGPVS